MRFFIEVRSDSFVLYFQNGEVSFSDYSHLRTVRLIIIDCYKNKLQLEIEGIIIDFISIGDLITAKKASGRLQDLADVENLKKILDKKGKS